MNGKELLLVLAGTAVAAGAGGIAAATILADQPADTGTDTAVLEQLEKLQSSLDGTGEIMEKSREEIAGLKQRIDAVEYGLVDTVITERSTADLSVAPGYVSA